MVMTFEVPEAGIETIEDQAVYAVGGSPEADEAEVLLESGGESVENGEAAREEITIVLMKDIDDPVSGFHGKQGETLTAYVDESGSTCIEMDSGDIILEAEEFEIVEAIELVALADADAAVAAVIAEPATGQPAATPLPPPAILDHAAADRRRAEYMREKDVLQEQIGALAIEQFKLKEQIKLCKKESEVMVERLNNLIEAWEHPAAVLSHGATEATGVVGENATADRTANNTAQTEPASQPDAPASTSTTSTATQLHAEPPKSSQFSQAKRDAAYRAALEAGKVEELDLPPKLIERLAEAGATTVWRLEQLRAEISQGREKWPKGVGEAKVTAIEDAILKWMSSHSACWDAVEGSNDAAEKAADEARAADVTESQPPTPAMTVDDL